MKVGFVNYSPARPGYGIFVLDELDGPMPAADKLSFMLKRSSDQKNLSQGGWQEAEAFLAPLNTFQKEGSLHLEVGPQVVDNLDLQEVYRFYLTWPGNERNPAAVLRVPELFYSPLGGGAGIIEALPEKNVQAPTRVTPTRATTLETALEPQPAPMRPVPGPAPAPLAEAALPAEPEAAARPDYIPAPARQKKRLPLIIALVALLLIAGGIIWYVTQKEQAAQIPPLQQAYQHLSLDNPSLEPTMQLAAQLKDSADADADDAAFLLFEYAAQKGDAKAMLMMGQYYDPLDKAPHGSIIKDGEQARAWYERALKAGLAGAQEKLRAVDQWLEENKEEE